MDDEDKLVGELKKITDAGEAMSAYEYMHNSAIGIWELRYNLEFNPW
ncbi:hypothetical protein BHO_0900024 (plasmid) [Borrelia hermsii YBT]|nr:hypothetical protein [Borrelia hermsii]AHH13036.1 hypothetical protein BHO_0900024 [Borrelia hermsii YBT]